MTTADQVKISTLFIISPFSTIKVFNPKTFFILVIFTFDSLQLLAKRSKVEKGHWCWQMEGL